MVDLYKNADSATEYALENKQIREWISRSKPDTAGLITGVYYQILKEGTGDLANLNDTVIVRYKGSLLNGDVFDQTDQKTATFPLKRLIKGWQIGVPMCREGGIIRLIIPSYLGYSIRNLGVIPPNSPLVFDITLEGLKKGKS
ncbi:MAG: FKBP-type peptidyl-prolyl cis-trans isomerase [Chitinophagaceae bacterium]|nr:FKBP-type peptidyl-prolyl cis-trans isomerase [Chitinophagaceae bacterium]